MIHQGQLESRQRGFTSWWHAANEYQIVDGFICPIEEGKPVRPRLQSAGQRPGDYVPMAHPDLPGELAKAATGDDADILAFARNYGLLGYAVAWRKAERLGVKHMSPEDVIEQPPGDPLVWFKAHASTVKLVLDLLGSLETEALLRTKLADLEARDEHNQYLIQYRQAIRGHLRPFRVQELRPQSRNDTGEVVGPPSFKTLRTTAMRIVASVINGNLGGVERTLQDEVQEDGGRRLTSLFIPCNLADCVYWHLADAAIGGWVRRCADPECGAYFVARSERVKYCPPPIGNEGVSPCMNRTKQREYRKRQAASDAAAKRGETARTLTEGRKKR